MLDQLILDALLEVGGPGAELGQAVDHVLAQVEAVGFVEHDHVEGSRRRQQQDAACKLLSAAVLSYDWSTDKATTCEVWIAHILRREAEAMLSLNLPTVPE